MFNPWIILAAIFVFVGFGLIEYDKGYAKATAENEAKVAIANEHSRDTEEKLANALSDNENQLKKVQKNADKKIKKLKSSIGDGSLRLSIPVIAQGCVQAPASAASASRDIGEVRAELDRQTAQNLVAITADGDAAIRKHAACVDAYNQVREQINANR